jgi:hypothetical protein
MLQYNFLEAFVSMPSGLDVLGLLISFRDWGLRICEYVAVQLILSFPFLCLLDLMFLAFCFHLGVGYMLEMMTF